MSISSMFGRTSLRDVVISRVGDDVKVVFGGKSTATDGKRISVADLPDSEDPEVRLTAEVSAYHESEHVRVLHEVSKDKNSIFYGAQTIGDLIRIGMSKAALPPQHIKAFNSFWNVFEDIRIDKRANERWPGTTEKYQAVEARLWKENILKNFPKMDPITKISLMAISKGRDMYYGELGYNKHAVKFSPMDELIYRKTLGQLEAKVAAMESIEDSMNLALEALEIVKNNFTPPPPPPPEEQQEDDGEGDDQQQSQGKGKGKGKGKSKPKDEDSEDEESEGSSSGESDESEEGSEDDSEEGTEGGKSEDESEEGEGSGEGESEDDSEEGDSKGSKGEGDEESEEGSEGSEGSGDEEGSEGDESEKGSKGGAKGDDKGQPQKPSNEDGEDVTQNTSSSSSVGASNTKDKEPEEACPEFPNAFKDHKEEVDLGADRIDTINAEAEDFYSVHPDVTDEFRDGSKGNNGIDWKSKGKPYFGGTEAKIRTILLDEKAPKIIKSLPRGKKLDTTHLYRHGDYRFGKQPQIWETRLQGSNIETAIRFSIDESGSMDGYAWNTQCAIQSALCGILDTCSVKYKVVGWTDGGNQAFCPNPENNCQRAWANKYRVYNDWGVRLNPGALPPHPMNGGTPTIDDIVLGLTDLSTRREARKAFVLFTDGDPSYYGQMANAAYKYAAEMLERARQAGYKTFGFGIGIDGHHPLMQKFFKDGWVGIPDNQDPGVTAVKIMEKLRLAFL